MKGVREVYARDVAGEAEDGYFVSPCDYNPLLQSMGYDILLQVDDDDCQGDSRLLLRDGDRYGVLIFGWGSCSGCDSLQGCNSWEEVSRLRDELRDSTVWGTEVGTLAYLRDHDWEGDFGWREENTRRFVREAIALLAGEEAEDRG